MRAPEMSLSELENYRPPLHPPIDFEAFWKRALASAVRHRAKFSGYRRVPDLPIETGELSYFGADGSVQTAKVVRLAGRGRRPIIVRFPGYDTPSPTLSELLPWAAAGFVVVAAGVRGQPNGGTDPSAYPGPAITGGVFTLGVVDAERSYYRHVYVDAVRAVEAACFVPGGDRERLMTYGESQGGGLALVAAALCAPGAVKAVASGFPFPSHIDRAVLLSDDGPYGELETFTRRIDPEGTSRAQVERTLGMIDVLHHASNVRVPVMMGIGLMDGVCPPSCSFAVLHHLGGPAKAKIFPAHGHEFLPGFVDAALAFARREVGSLA